MCGVAYGTFYIVNIYKYFCLVLNLNAAFSSSCHTSLIFISFSAEEQGIFCKTPWTEKPIPPSIYLNWFINILHSGMFIFARENFMHRMMHNLQSFSSYVSVIYTFLAHSIPATCAPWIIQNKYCFGKTERKPNIKIEKVKILKEQMKFTMYLVVSYV